MSLIKYIKQLSTIILILLSVSRIEAHEINYSKNIANDLAWTAVLHYLSWTKYWYGDVFGQPCFFKQINKSVPVSFYYYLNALSETPETTVDNNCDYAKRKEVALNIGNVYIHNTGVLFKLWGLSETTSRPYKLRAFIVLGCSFKDNCQPADECLDIISKKNDRHDLKEWEISFTENRMIPDILSIDNNEFVKDSHLIDIVLNAVRRSMQAYLKHLYFEKPLKNEVRFDNITLDMINKVKKNRKLFVGKFTLNDPAFLVFYEGDNSLCLLDFPSVEVLSNECYCMQVSSSLPYRAYDLPYYNEKEASIIKQKLITKLKANSIELKLPKNWYERP